MGLPQASIDLHLPLRLPPVTCRRVGVVLLLADPGDYVAPPLGHQPSHPLCMWRWGAMDEAPALYGVGKLARSICAVEGDARHHRFLVGTLCLQENNEISLIEYDDVANRVACRRRFAADGEVWQVAACPTSERHFATVSGKGRERVATLWEAAEEGQTTDDGAPAREELTAIGSFEGDGDGGGPQHLMWQPVDVDDAVGDDGSDADDEDGHEAATGPSLLSGTLPSTQLVCVCSEHLSVHQVAPGGLTESGRLVGTESVAAPFGVGSWDPHHGVQLSVAQGGDLVGFDIRSQCEVRRVRAIHGSCVRDVDYNPNRPWYLVTCGDDDTTKFWDVRRGGDVPVKTLRSHKHWVWRARYNRCHDQLVVTSSTDSNVDLWRMASISSAPLLDTDEADAAETPRDRSEDKLLAKIDSHEDSVYGLAWSAAEPWVFASLSYDGRVAINTVPAAEKYQILL